MWDLCGNVSLTMDVGDVSINNLRTVVRQLVGGSQHVIEEGIHGSKATQQARPV